MESSSTGLSASDAELGRLATDRVWKSGVEKAKYDEVDSVDFATSALTRCIELTVEHAGDFMREMVAGAEIGAQQLHVEPFCGVLEVLQNADDAGAGRVRVAVAHSDVGQQLCLAHDGTEDGP